MLATARTANTEAAFWRPHPGQQERFLASSAYEGLVGGAAGPGKTDCLLMESLRQVAHPYYTAIFFRRTFPMLEAANGPIQRSLRWFPTLGGEYNQSKHVWQFPSGARIYFGHMEREGDENDYQGAEFCYIAFDELTEFSEKMYLFLFTRCRAPAPGLRAYIRAGTNPGGVGHAWVKRRFITRDIRNRARHFAQVDGKDTEVAADYPYALSRAFYPALLSDNPSADPGYRARIRATGDPVTVARLEHGDWDIEYAEGLIYDTFSLDGNVTVSADYNPDLPVYAACDDGYVYGDGPAHANYHPRVILLAQDNALGGLSIFDEYVVTDETHDQTLTAVFGSRDGQAPAAIERFIPYRRPSVAYIDGSAAMFRDQITYWDIPSVNATHRVVEGIKEVRQLVLDGNGVRRLLVHPRCQQLIYEMGEYRSDPKGRADAGEIVPLKLDDHCVDAVRYLCHERRHYTGAA